MAYASPRRPETIDTIGGRCGHARYSRAGYKAPLHAGGVPGAGVVGSKFLSMWVWPSSRQGEGKGAGQSDGVRPVPAGFGCGDSHEDCCCASEGYGGLLFDEACVHDRPVVVGRADPGPRRSGFRQPVNAVAEAGASIDPPAWLSHSQGPPAPDRPCCVGERPCRVPTAPKALPTPSHCWAALLPSITWPTGRPWRR